MPAFGWIVHFFRIVSFSFIHLGISAPIRNHIFLANTKHSNQGQPGGFAPLLSALCATSGRVRLYGMGGERIICTLISPKYAYIFWHFPSFSSLLLSLILVVWRIVFDSFKRSFTPRLWATYHLCLAVEASQTWLLRAAISSYDQLSRHLLHTTRTSSSFNALLFLVFQIDEVFFTKNSLLVKTTKE